MDHEPGQNGHPQRADTEATRGDRGPAGRFAAGNSIGKLGGNPTAKRMRALRGALLDAASDEDIRAIGAKLAEMGRAGDVPAARTWLEFVIGKPPAAVEVSGPDGEPLGVNFYQLQVLLLDALRDHPAARVALASRLRELARADDAGRPGEGD